MREEKKKARGNADEGDLSKVQEVSAEVDDFVEFTFDIKNAIDYLMDALESLRQRLELVLDDDEIAVSEGRIAITLLSLLAEQAEKLKNQATSYRDNVEQFMDT